MTRRPDALDRYLERDEPWVPPPEPPPRPRVIIHTDPRCELCGLPCEYHEQICEACSRWDPDEDL